MIDCFEKANLDLATLLRGSNNLVFLVGAGISMDQPAGLPSARQMMAALVDYGAPANVKDALLQIPALRYEFLIEVFRTYYDAELKLVDFFEEATSPNALHYYLVRMLHQGNWVLTTNFDYLIERAFTTTNANFQVVITPQDFSTYMDPRKWYQKGTCVLYKLHGSTKNAKTGAMTRETLVTTISSLGKSREGDVFSVEVWKRALFENIGQDRTLVVMGYSGGDDFDIVPMLRRIPGLRRIIWIVHDPTLGAKYTCWKLRFPSHATPTTTAFTSREDELLTLLQAQSPTSCPEIFKVQVHTGQFVQKIYPPPTPPSITPALTHDVKQWVAQNYSPASNASREIFAAVIFQNYGRFENALVHFRNLLTMYQQVNDETRIGTTYVNMGHNHRFLGQYDLAQECYQKAVPFLEKMHLTEELAWVTANMGWIYRQQKAYEKAFQAIKASHDIFCRTNNPLGIANTAMDLANILKETSHLDEASGYLQEVIPIYEALGDLTNLAWTFANMGCVVRDKKKTKIAIDYFERALSIFKKLGNLDGIKNTEYALNALRKQ